MLRYYITDRRGVGGVEALLANIERQIFAGVDWVQIREKDLSARELLDLVRSAKKLTAGRALLFVNSRFDVAVAGGADGVHLPSHSIAVSEFRRFGMRVGVSCHNLEELRRAERQGADYAVLSPVFRPLSKKIEGEALGLEVFGELARAVHIPVLALGGITEETIPLCEAAGAAGVAGISLFQPLARRVL